MDEDKFPEEDYPANMPESASKKKPKSEDLIIEAKNFFNFNKEDLGESIRKKTNTIFLDFMKLTEFSNKLSDEIIINPEETLSLIEQAVEELGLVKNIRIRLKNLSDAHQIKIRNIRSKNLNELIILEGIIRQASDVRPQVVNAKFECPSCGTVISVLQIEKKFREPSRCSCGRRGGFRLISKDMVDTQRLVVEESPESLSGGEQPKRINVFVKEDLVEPRMEEKTTPGARIKIIGILKEVPVPLSTGGLSTRFELAVEANNIIPLEETFEELDITDEDERQIQELSEDPKIYENLAKSIVPSVWGYEEIKRALVLQLFGGVQKQMSDGSKSRGDIHILLIGDPGVAKSIGPKEKVLYYLKDSSDEFFGYEEIEKIFEKFGRFPKNLNVLTIDQQKQKPRWEQISEIIKHFPEKELIKVITSHGKSIIATEDHSFITLKNGEIVPIKGEELTEENYLPIPIEFHKELFKKLNIKKFKTFKTNSKEIPNFITLNEEAGFFFGIFLSEGYIREGKTVIISNKNKKIQEKVKKFVKELGLEAKSNEKEAIINSTTLSNVLKNYCYNEEEKEQDGIKGNYSRIKEIPDFSFFAPREFIKGIISGLFSGDGRFVKDKEKIKGFELISVSEKLIRGTSDLLFSLGILNKINISKYTYKNKTNPLFKIYIPSQSIKKFRKNFNFYGRSFLTYSKPIYSYNNLIPCGELVYELTRKLGYNKRSGGDRTFAAEMRTVKNRGVIGRLRLRKIIKKFERRTNEKLKELETLKKLAYSQIIWSKIEKIESIKGKGKEVYDLNIPSTNTFVSNGIGVHNSVTLGFMAKISPKGRYVVGKSTSGAGLTATVVRDEYLKGWSLEAGAMVLANKGLICIDELEKMDPQDRSAMHEAMEQQCMLPDFKLMLSNGKYVEIGEFVDNLIEKNKNSVCNGKNCEILPLDKLDKVKLLSTDFSKHFPLNANKVSRHIAPKEFVKIELVNGREITVTPEHPCWIVENGKIKTIPAEKLKPNMFFPIPSEIKISNAEYKKENDYLCKILGYHISDGCYELNRGKKTGIQFWNNNEELIKDYKSSIENYFKITPLIVKRKNQFSVRVISKKVAEEFIELDKNLLEKGNLKKIPDSIMQFSNENIKYLLKALYDGDGSVSTQKRNGCRISFVSQNRELEEQMSDLLLRFGIQSSIFEDRHSKVWRLDISGQENLSRFLSKVGFLSKNKIEKLKKYCEINKKYKTITDIIPNCTDKISEIFKKLKISQRKEIGHSIDLNVEKQRLFLQKLVKIAMNKTMQINTEEACKIREELKEIEKLAFGYARWAKIKNVSKIKNNNTKWVYDVTIEPYHTFISNGMILHNTVTISKANVQACYSEDTEVLTEEGWKKYNEVKNLKIAQFNPKNKTINFLDHKGLFIYDYNKEMYHFKDKRNDILVTPNHKMLFREPRHKEFQARPAEEINYKRIEFLNSGEYDNKEVNKFILPAIKHKQNRIHDKYVHQHFPKEISMDLWLEFIGYYVTEGGKETAPTIGITQKAGKNADKIEKCLIKLSKYIGFTLTKIPYKDYFKFKITNTQIYNFLTKSCGEHSEEKRIPLKITELSKRQLKILFDALMLGDGSKDGKNFGSTSEELTNQIQIIGMLLGKSASKHLSYKEKTRGNRQNLYRIIFSNQITPQIKQNSIKKIKYNGKVWCFSTETGFFVTRRNGKIAIQGNTLKAQTSVLAAANPKFGRFDPFMPIPQQIDLPPTLINRFDIIFTLRDIPNRTKDEKIATHVLKEHQKETKEVLIDTNLFRKYVAYAKQKINPKLGTEAVEEIKKFYVELRNKPVTSESAMRPIPISARQLQALIRMAEASAKLRLSEIVSKEDAKRAIELMTYYLMQVGYDYESKTFDIDRISGKFSSSQRNKIFMVKEVITALESKMGKMIPYEEIEKELGEKMGKDELEEVINRLVKDNEIYRPKKGYIGVF